MKRLAFCLYNYFPYGGLQRDFLRIARRCEAAGARIRVYTMRWEGDLPEGWELRLLKRRGFSNHARARHFAEQVADALLTEPVDCLVGFNAMPGLDIYFAGDTCFAAKMARRSLLSRMLPRTQLFLAHERAVFGDGKSRILLLTPRQKREFQQFHGTPDQRLRMLPPGVAAPFFDPADAALHRRQIRHELGLEEGQVLLLMVGSAFRTKGVDRAIRALAALPETLRQAVKLAVVGRGEADAYGRLAGRLWVGAQVRFLGARDDVKRYMQAADLLIHPARTEAAGMALVESLATGLPVLCSGECGYACHVEASGAGIVLEEPFSQEELNRRLRELLAEGELHKLAAQARDYSSPQRLGGLDTVAAQAIMEWPQW